MKERTKDVSESYYLLKEKFSQKRPACFGVRPNGSFLVTEIITSNYRIWIWWPMPSLSDSWADQSFDINQPEVNPGPGGKGRRLTGSTGWGEKPP